MSSGKVLGYIEQPHPLSLSHSSIIRLQRSSPVSKTVGLHRSNKNPMEFFHLLNDTKPEPHVKSEIVKRLLVKQKTTPNPKMYLELWSIEIQMGVSKNRGTPKWMVYNGKPYIFWMILGVPLFSETSKSREKAHSGCHDTSSDTNPSNC